MRKIKNLLLLLAFSATAIGGLSAVLNKSSSAPLDVVAESVDEYYSSCDTSTRQKLMDSLKTRLNNGAVNLGYDGLWSAYYTTDVKPGTNYIWDMYSNIDFVVGGPKQGHNYSKEGDGYNREHTVPQAWFDEASPMKADLFHVYPTDGWVNNKRNNYPHGEVGTATYTSQNGSKLGSSSYPGISGTVFEPIDEYKGDFARTYFYMATRYKDRCGSWDGPVFSSSFPNINSNYLEMYYKWHLNDPVSDKETNRNNEAFKLQKNRNPYIDHPEWVDYVFKGITPTPLKTIESLEVTGTPNRTTYTEGDAFEPAGLTVTATYSDKSTANVTNSVVWSQLVAGSTTVTGTYSGKTVTVTGLTILQGTKKVTGVSLNEISKTLQVSETFQLNATVTPTDAQNKSVVWSTSNSGIATVSTSGLVTAVSPGTANITVTTVDGGFQATCTIIVANPSGDPVSVEIDFRKNNSKFTDSAGNTWTSNGSCTAGSSYLSMKSGGKIESSSIGLDLDQPVNIDVKVGYYGGNAASISAYAVNGSGQVVSNVGAGKPTSNKENSFKFTLSFTNKDSHDLKIVFESKDCDSSHYIRFFGATIGYTPYNPSPSPKVNSISLPSSLSIDLNNSSTGTLVPTVDADEGATYTINWSSSNTSVATVSGNNSSATITALKEGSTTITASIGDLSDTCSVTIIPLDKIVGIEVEKVPDKVLYKVGETFDPTGLVVKAQHLNGTKEDISDKVSLSEVSTEATGVVTVEVTYLTFKDTFSITVKDKALKDLILKKTPAKIEYYADEEFNPYGTVIEAKFDDDSVIEDVTDQCTFSYDFSKDNYVKYTFGGITRSLQVAILYGNPTVLHKAADFAYSFIEKLDDVEAKDVTLEQWDSLKYDFNKLDDESKNYVKNLKVDNGAGEVGADIPNAEALKECVIKYDTTYLAHKNDGYEDFIGRDPKSNNDSKKDKNNDALIILIGVVGGIVVLAIIIICIAVSVSKKNKKKHA